GGDRRQHRRHGRRRGRRRRDRQRGRRALRRQASQVAGRSGKRGAPSGALVVSTYNRRMGKAEEIRVSAVADRAARVDLAAAFRLAVRMDLHEGVCNHFTFMLPDGKRFLLNRYGLHWSEVSASNLLALDATGEILEGEGEFEKTAFYIHSRIHLANPKAACVLHTHMPYATALTLLENGRLEMVEQNALRFHDDIAYDDTYNGLVVDNAEGDRLARAMGSKRVLL